MKTENKQTYMTGITAMTRTFITFIHFNLDNLHTQDDQWSFMPQQFINKHNPPFIFWSYASLVSGSWTNRFIQYNGAPCLPLALPRITAASPFAWLWEGTLLTISFCPKNPLKIISWTHKNIAQIFHAPRTRGYILTTGPQPEAASIPRFRTKGKILGYVHKKVEWTNMASLLIT